MSSVTQRHFERAKVIAAQSSCRQKHGVVIAKGTKVIAVAVNTNRNHPDIVSNPKTEASYHAEANALRQLFRNDDLDHSKLTLYSVRIGRNGKMALAKPCEHCAYLIELAGIKNVYHS